MIRRCRQLNRGADGNTVYLPYFGDSESVVLKARAIGSFEPEPGNLGYGEKGIQFWNGIMWLPFGGK